MLTSGMAGPRFCTPSTANITSISESNCAIQSSERRRKMSRPIPMNASLVMV